MDGRPLYEYARKGIPLPRPIEKRPVNVYSLDLQTFQHSQQHTELLQRSDLNAVSKSSGSGHSYTPPAKVFTQEERDALRKMLHSASAEEEFPSLETPPKEEKYPESTPPIFKIRVACSGGTYIRNIAHDMGIALGSAAHIVKLERVKQGDWSLERAIDWEIFQEALKVGETEESKQNAPSEGEQWREWEEKVMDKWEVIEPNPNAGAHFDGRNAKKPKEASKPQDNRVGTPPVPSSTTVDAGKGNAADI
jgi:tRNA pseudouridine55 synthase